MLRLSLIPLSSSTNIHLTFLSAKLCLLPLPCPFPFQFSHSSQSFQQQFLFFVIFVFIVNQSYPLIQSCDSTFFPNPLPLHTTPWFLPVIPAARIRTPSPRGVVTQVLLHLCDTRCSPWSLVTLPASLRPPYVSLLPPVSSSVIHFFSRSFLSFNPKFYKLLTTGVKIYHRVFLKDTES